LRQNSDVHEEVVSELLAWAGVHPDYRSLPKMSESSYWRANSLPGDHLSATAPVVRPGTKRTRHRRGRRPRRRDYGPAAVPIYVISMCQSVSDVLEAAILLKESACWTLRGRNPIARGHLTALRNDRRSAQRAAILRGMLKLPIYRALVAARGESRK